MGFFMGTPHHGLRR